MAPVASSGAEAGPAALPYSSRWHLAQQPSCIPALQLQQHTPQPPSSKVMRLLALGLAALLLACSCQAAEKASVVRGVGLGERGSSTRVRSCSPSSLPTACRMPPCSPSWQCLAWALPLAGATPAMGAPIAARPRRRMPPPPLPPPHTCAIIAPPLPAPIPCRLLFHCYVLGDSSAVAPSSAALPPVCC